MAILTKIRNRAGLAVGLVGFALVAFVVSDAINNNIGIFRSQDMNAGEVNGKKISFVEFEQKSKEMEGEMMLQRNLETIDPQTREMIKEQVWNTFVEEQTTNVEYEKTGIANMSDEELMDMINGPNPDQNIQQTFKGQDGKFDRNILNYFLKKQINEDAKAKAQWILFEDGLRKQRISQKYAMYVKAGMNVNKLEAQENYNNGNNSRNFKFVALNYNTVSDSSIKLTDEDYKKYFQANSYKFKQEASKDIKFALFDVNPSSKDSQEVFSKVNNVLATFKNAVNDSQIKAGLPEVVFDTNYYAYKNPNRKFPDAAIEDSLFYAPIGKVVGPYYSNGAYKLAKLMGVKEDSAWTMKASHILVPLKSKSVVDSLAAKADAEKILAEIKGGRTFEEMAMEKGTDGTKDKGGDLGWFREGDGFVKEFTDGVKPHVKGDMFILKTQFGYHIIKVTENKTRRMIKVANYEEILEASSETQTKAQSKANEFRSKVSNMETFEKVATDMGLILRNAPKVKSGDRFVQGLTDPKEIIRWVFENKKGDVSDVIFSDNKYIIAIITGSREKGIPSWEDVKDEITPEVYKMKKAETFIVNFEKALGTSKQPLELALALKTVVQDATNHRFNNPNIPYAGNEPKLLGTAFGMKQGKFSKILEGNNGVYVVWVDQIVNSTNAPKDFKDIQKEMTQQSSGSGEYLAKAAIKENAVIVDKRYRISGS
jgi:peptidyl-prolyl cis-trans isomerase D